MLYVGVGKRVVAPYEKSVASHVLGIGVVAGDVCVCESGLLAGGTAHEGADFNSFGCE